MERILLVDDDREIVRLLRSYLEKAGYTVFVAYDGETALHTLRREHPDLLILDLMLPDRDGWDITRLIRSDHHLMALPIIMLTARVEDTDKIVGLEIGADDYISKPFNPREVVARVRALLRRSQYERSAGFSQVLQSSDLRLDMGQRTLTIHNEPVELTPSEFKLLQVLMENPGYVFTRDELMEKALNYAFEGIGRPLDSHIKNLRNKIEPDPRQPTYIQTVYGIGYRFIKKKDEPFVD
ncbi:MAG: response regulator transcription factor [Anaerolineales bacterium]|nr:response regulator transcription factor [Anaerolineales bacterium]